jgi:nitroreductase
MLKNIRRYLARKRSVLRFYSESFVDARRYLKAAKIVTGTHDHETEHLESDIIRRYHVIEKGLSMPEFRPRFGADMVRQLSRYLEQWEQIPREKGACTNNQIEAAYAVLEAYRQRHSELGIDISDILGNEPSGVPCQNGESKGGVMPLPEIAIDDGEAFSRVVHTRTSVRDFKINRIPEQTIIKKAVSLATRSPSVCNRQTWRVHIYEGNRAQEVLALQNGNRGFGQTIPMVLIPTSDMRYFTGSIERYQPWIDGGMFSMTLLLALHAEGLGAVSLNWSVDNARDEALRKTANIPDHERIMMLIGCGYPKEGAVVARSLRWPVEHFIRWDKPAGNAE